MFLDLSPSGWIDGLTSGAIIISSTIFGILSIIKGTKNRAKLLVIAGINAIVVGSFWLGPFVDFLWYGILDTHIIIELYPLLSYSQVFVGVIMIGILGGELITPNYKGAVLGAMTALGMMLFAIIYTWVWAMAFNIGYLSYVNPALEPYDALAPFVPFKLTEGTSTDLIDASYAPWSPAMMLIWIIQFYNLLFMGGGFLIKAKQSMGDLRKKFLLLSSAFILFFCVGIIDSIFSDIDWLVTIARIVMCSYALLLYLGLRE
jgi:hypothetical protein